MPYIDRRRLLQLASMLPLWRRVGSFPANSFSLFDLIGLSRLAGD